MLWGAIFCHNALWEDLDIFSVSRVNLTSASLADYSFSKIQIFFFPIPWRDFKNHCTNTRLVCTQLNVFCKLNWNVALKIWILWKKIVCHLSALVGDAHLERVVHVWQEIHLYHVHSKTPHVVTVLWQDSDDVVTILSPTRNLVEGYKMVYLCHLDSYTVTVCNGYLVSSHVVTMQLLTTVYTMQ